MANNYTDRLISWKNNETPLNEKNLNAMRDFILRCNEKYTSDLNLLDKKYDKKFNTLRDSTLVDAMYALCLLNGVINPALRAGEDIVGILYDKYGFEIESYPDEESRYPHLTYIYKYAVDLDQDREELETTLNEIREGMDEMISDIVEDVVGGDENKESESEEN